MPFSNGTYTPPTGATNAASGQVIASATWNAIFTDLASAITTLNQFYPVVLVGRALNVDLNVANTDTAIAITLPSGVTNYRVNNCFVRNKGTTASLTVATAGLFTAAAAGGLALAANQALSAITANAIGTDANMMNLTLTIGNRTAINSSTLYFRVGTAQGAAATADIFIPVTLLV